MIDSAAPNGPLDQNFDLEDQYVLSRSIANLDAIAETWIKRSASALANYEHREYSYGPGPYQDLMFFPARLTGSDSRTNQIPLLVFIHGGYWQETHKDFWFYLAPPYVERGIAVAIVDYPLCPSVTIEDIVQAMRQCVHWLWSSSGDLGVHQKRIVVAGHSAGGHLAAMLALTDWQSLDSSLPPQLLSSAVCLSGLYDLEPLLRTSLNEALQLDQAAARRNSPLHVLRNATSSRRPFSVPPLVAAVGGLETSEFHRQQAEFVMEWRSQGYEATVIELPGCHHFAVLEELIREDSPLFAKVLALAAAGER